MSSIQGDMVFRAVLDDRGFKRGLNSTVRDARQASDTFSRKGGGMGFDLKRAFGGFSGGGVIGGVAAGLGITAGIAAIKRLWSEATHELENYGKVNDRVFADISRTNQAIEKGGRPIGRALDALGINKMREGLAGIPGSIVDSVYKTVAPEDRERQIAEEARTYRRQQERIFRDVGGPMDEAVLRMQGREGAAGALGATRRGEDMMDDLRRRHDSREIGDREYYRLLSKTQRLGAFEVADARRQDTRGFSGEVPTSLRPAIGGAPGVFDVKLDKLVEISDKQYEATLETNELLRQNLEWKAAPKFEFPSWR